MNAAKKEITVYPLLTETSIIRTPLYYGQFVWSEKCQKSYIPYPYNTDKSVNRTIGSVPLVSVLKRFDCSRPLWNVNSEGGGGGVYSERPSVVGGGGEWIFSEMTHGIINRLICASSCLMVAIPQTVNERAKIKLDSFVVV